MVGDAWGPDSDAASWSSGTLRFDRARRRRPIHRSHRRGRRVASASSYELAGAIVRAVDEGDGGGTGDSWFSGGTFATPANTKPHYACATHGAGRRARGERTARRGTHGSYSELPGDERREYVCQSKSHPEIPEDRVWEQPRQSDHRQRLRLQPCRRSHREDQNPRATEWSPPNRPPEQRHAGAGGLAGRSHRIGARPQAAPAVWILIQPTPLVSPEGQSSGELVASWMPAGAHFAKAFNSLPADLLASSANRQPKRAALFYAHRRRRGGKQSRAADHRGRIRSGSRWRDRQLRTHRGWWRTLRWPKSGDWQGNMETVGIEPRKIPTVVA
jgi:hypothetical protein